MNNNINELEQMQSVHLLLMTSQCNLAAFFILVVMMLLGTVRYFLFLQIERLIKNRVFESLELFFNESCRYQNQLHCYSHREWIGRTVCKQFQILILIKCSKYFLNVFCKTNRWWWRIISLKLLKSKQMIFY